VTHTSFEDIATRRREDMDEAARADYESKKAALAVALRVGIAIRDARENAGLTQTDLAARMGVSQPALARIEAGRTNVTLATLAKIAAGLDTVLLLGVGASSVSLEAAKPSGRHPPRADAPRNSGARPEGGQIPSRMAKAKSVASDARAKRGVITEVKSADTT
jgi:transcriptional regulator with XRE-family HTH domain